MADVQRRFMTVGELSRRTGVSVKNLRQYTDWGLIYSVGRSNTGYRLFDSEALWCVDRIGKLRGLGLTVAEIRELGRSRRSGRPVGPLLAEQLRVSRDRIEARIAELRGTLNRIDGYVDAHEAELADDSGVCWEDDPRCGRPGGPTRATQAADTRTWAADTRTWAADTRTQAAGTRT